MKKRKSTSAVIVIAILVAAAIGFLVFLENNPEYFTSVKPGVSQDKNRGKAAAKNKSVPGTQPAQMAASQQPAIPIPAMSANALGKIKPSKFTQGLFWKVEKPGVKPSYVLGTIHVSRDELAELKEKVKPVILQTDSLCTEIKLDLLTTLKAQKAMMYSGGKTLKQAIGDELYARVIKVVTERKMPIAAVGRMKPWAVMVFLNYPKDAGTMLDLELSLYADRNKKEICGLEQVEEQLSAFNTYSLETQIKMLKSTLDHMAMIDGQQKQLFQLYLKRDLAGMVNMMEKSPMVSDKKLINEFIYRLVVRRNVIMVNRMQPYLQRGKAFFAVGALHLPGEAGVLRLLESQGYKITKLY